MANKKQKNNVDRQTDAVRASVATSHALLGVGKESEMLLAVTMGSSKERVAAARPYQERARSTRHTGWGPINTHILRTYDTNETRSHARPRMFVPHPFSRSSSENFRYTQARSYCVTVYVTVFFTDEPPPSTGGTARSNTFSTER